MLNKEIDNLIHMKIICITKEYKYEVMMKMGTVNKLIIGNVILKEKSLL